MENLAGLVAAYRYYDKMIAKIGCDTLERYMARTGAPISAKEFNAYICEILNNLEHRRDTVAEAIDRLIDSLEEEE